MIPIISLTLIVVAIVLGAVLYVATKSLRKVGYAYQSLFALVALVMSQFAFESLPLVVIDLLALGLLINGLLSLYKMK
ncbi:hypothetical protein ACFLY8_02905 [Halobacteriota archaeon]